MYIFSQMLSLERIPDQIGYLVLTEDGSVLTVIVIIMFIFYKFDFLS